MTIVLGSVSEIKSITAFGVAGDGSDESTNIQLAFSSGYSLFIPEPPVYYKCKDIIVPAGTKIFGESKAPYLALTVTAITGLSAFVFDETGTFHFKWGDRCIVEDVIFYGTDKSKDLWLSDDGGKLKEFKINRIGVYHYVAGLGGLTHQFGQVEAYQCNLSSNTFGTRGLVDSKIVGGFINANSSHGVSIGTGDNDNAFVGIKNEFNDGHGWDFGAGVNNSVVGGTTDGSLLNGFKFGSGSDTVVTGVQIRRSNRDDTVGEYHVLIDGAARVIMSTAGTRHGFNDGGGGSDSPINGAMIQGPCGLVMLEGCDFTGINGGIPLQIDAGATFSQAISIRNCPSVNDVAVDMSINVKNRANVIQTLGTGNLSAAASFVLSYSDQTQGTFTRVFRNLTMYARDTSTGVTLSGAGSFVRSREGSGVLMANFDTSYEGGVDQFGDAGADDVQIAFSNIATDGSTFDITVTNNSSNTLNVTLDLS